MSSPDIEFGEGDQGPVVTDVLYGSEVDDLGNAIPLDLTGRTVIARYRDKDQVNPEIDDAGVAVTGDPTQGGVLWTPSSPVVGGEYNFNWVVIDGPGAPITVPNDRYLWMSVLPKP